MKKSISLLATIAVLASSLPVATNAATKVYDREADWSDTQNPNGSWSYRQGNGLLINNAENRYLIEPAHALTPDKVFDRRWATTLLDQAMVQLRDECISVRGFRSSAAGLLLRGVPFQGSMNPELVEVSFEAIQLSFQIWDGPKENVIEAEPFRQYVVGDD